MPVMAGLRRAFQSLQARMVIIYLLLILFAMEVIGNYLLFSLRAYYLNQQFDNMTTIAKLVEESASRSMEQSNRPALARDLDNLVRVFGEKGLSLFILDRDGEVISAYREEEGAGQGTSLNGVPEVRQALSGVYLRTPNLRVHSETGKRKAFFARPITSGGRVVGAVYLEGSMDRIEKTLTGMKGILFSATIIALVISAVLSYILARTITGPVKELTSRAEALAGGDFDQLIQVRSDDEIGRLAGMFNHLSTRLKETLAEISSEKQKAEAILIHMTDGIIALDRSGRILLVNPAAASMTGIDAREAIGLGLGDVLPDSGLEELASAVVRGERDEAVGRLVFTGPDLVLNAHVAPVREQGQAPGGVVIVLHDITQHEKLDRNRKEFVANVSHELRTPLTTIKSYVETLLEDSPDDPEMQKRFLGVVAGETERMVRLVNDLLTLSHLDSGRLRWEKKPMSVESLVREIQEKFADRCYRKGVRLVSQIQPDTPAVLGDRDRLEQVISNLLNNAVDFTPPGGRVSLNVESEAGWVTVTVSDTGVGIPSEDLPRIFERFYRVDKARSRQFGGTGLGLSIAKEIIEAHGGEISISSEAGQGTEVVITLPALEGGVAGIRDDEPEALTG